MKKLTLLLLLIFICVDILIAQQMSLAVDRVSNLSIAEQRKTANAAQYLNQKVTLTGLVYDFGFLNNSTTTVLYIDGNFPNQNLAIIIDDNTSSFIKNPEIRIRGNYATVTGIVKKFRGKPAIEISNWNEVGFREAVYKLPLAFETNKKFNKYYKPLAQYYYEGINDTVTYLFDNFLFHQNLYRGKELNVLLNKINLSVKNYLFISEGNKEAINLEFDNGDMVHKSTFKSMPAVLRIFFKQQASEKALAPINGTYTQNIKQYYGKQIIDSIDYWVFHRNVKLPHATGY